MRFVAIGIVILAHLFAVTRLRAGDFGIEPPFGSIDPFANAHGRDLIFLSWGPVGVYIFFVLSGFILAVPFIRWRVAEGPPVETKRYLLRRLTRIEPPFVIAALLLFAVASLAGYRGLSGHLLATLSYSHLAYFRTFSPIDGVFWSLEAEIQWYLVVPFLAIVLCRGSSRERLLKIGTLIVGSIALQFLLGPAIFWRFILLDHLQFFLCGWLLAEIHVAHLHETPLEDARFDVVAVLGFLGLFVAMRLHPPLWRVTVPLAGALFVGAALHGRIARRFLSIGWIATLGGMCYSLYLIHYPVLILGQRAFLSHLPSKEPWIWAGCALLLVIALVISTAFFMTVERPCMDPTWAQRLATRINRLVGQRAVPQHTEVLVPQPETPLSP